jgi:hypothetical protein
MYPFRFLPLTLSLILCLWAGIVVGVSFLATPAKFLASDLASAVALDVGRHTFHVLAWVEHAAVALAIGLCILGRPGRFARLGVFLICVLLAIQHFWLLPGLDARVQQILDGSQAQPSPHHRVFVVLESVKVISLIATSVAAGWPSGVARRSIAQPAAAALDLCCPKTTSPDPYGAPSGTGSDEDAHHRRAGPTPPHSARQLQPFPEYGLCRKGEAE